MSAKALQKTAMLSSKFQPATESEGALPARIAPANHHPNCLSGQDLSKQSFEVVHPAMPLMRQPLPEVPNWTKSRLLRVQEEEVAVWQPK